MYKRQVYDSNKNYHYSAYLLDLLDTTKEQKEGLMTSQLRHEDRTGYFDKTSSTNTGFAKRAVLAGRSIPLIGRLHSELFNRNVT